MIDRLDIRPVEGLIVRDPHTRKPIPSEGVTVDRSPYWIRRLRDGDVVPVETKATKKNARGRKAKTED